MESAKQFEKIGKVAEEKILGKPDPVHKKFAERHEGEVVDSRERLEQLLSLAVLYQPKITEQNPEKVFSKMLTQRVRELLLRGHEIYSKNWELKSVKFCTTLDTPLDKMGIDAFVDIILTPKDPKGRLMHIPVTIDITIDALGNKLAGRMVADVTTQFSVSTVDDIHSVLNDAEENSVTLLTSSAIFEKFSEAFLKKETQEHEEKKNVLQCERMGVKILGERGDLFFVVRKGSSETHSRSSEKKPDLWDYMPKRRRTTELVEGNTFSGSSEPAIYKKLTLKGGIVKA